MYSNNHCGMKQIAILLCSLLGYIYVDAQSVVLDSTEMMELMEIIELQKKIESTPDEDDRYDGIWIRKGQNPYGEILFTIQE